MPKGHPGSTPGKQCQHCEKIFYPSKDSDRIYCSLECYWAYKKIRGDRPPLNGGLDILRCDNCGKEEERPAFIAKTRRFCSRICYFDYMRRYAPSEPLRFGKDYQSTFWRVVRREVRKRDGFICQICRPSKPMSGQRLTVHHKLPRAFFENFPWLSDHPDNLVTVCYSCHYALHFGAPNAHRRRPSREVVEEPEAVSAA